MTFCDGLYTCNNCIINVDFEEPGSNYGFSRWTARILVHWSVCSNPSQVIPLSQRSGVVQWCVDTIPLGQYLVVGEQSAHRRYYPTSPSSAKCREAITVSTSSSCLAIFCYIYDIKIIGVLCYCSLVKYYSLLI